jgi:hypothetical protein
MPATFTIWKQKRVGVRFRVRPVGILVIGEGKMERWDEIDQNSGLCKHL